MYNKEIIKDTSRKTWNRKQAAKDSGVVSKIKWSFPVKTILSRLERVAGEEINPNNAKPKQKNKNENKTESDGSDESEVGCTFTEYQIKVLALYYIVLIIS